MPKELHNKLTRQANKKGLKGNDKNAYVYGTMDRVEKRKHTANKLKAMSSSKKKY